MPEPTSLGEILVEIGNRVKKNAMPDWAFHDTQLCGLLLRVPGVEQMIVDRGVSPNEAPWCKCDQNIAEAAAQRMKDSNIPHRLPGDKPRSFDNFIAREGAAEAYDVAYTFTHKQQGSSILTLVGGTGTGKSHLAEAICRDAVMTGSVRYEYTPHLMDRMRATFNNDSGDSVEDIIAKLTSARVVVLDDLGTEKGSDFTQERLTSIVEQRMARHAKTVITTNLDRKKLEGKGYERLASRLWATGTGEAIVQELTCPDARLYGLPPAPELPF
jgi:DNA replication protein DnaC